MNYTRLLLGSIVGAIVNFLAGWLIYGIMMKNMMDKYMTPEAKAIHKTEAEMGSMEMTGIFVSGLIYALLVAYIFEKWAKIRTFMGGVSAGALIGLLFAASMDVFLASMLKMYADKTFILIDIAANIVMGGLIGGAIGWCLGMNRKD